MKFILLVVAHILPQLSFAQVEFWPRNPSHDTHQDIKLANVDVDVHFMDRGYRVHGQIFPNVHITALKNLLFKYDYAIGSDNNQVSKINTEIISHAHQYCKTFGELELAKSRQEMDKEIGDKLVFAIDTSSVGYYANQTIGSVVCMITISYSE